MITHGQSPKLYVSLVLCPLKEYKGRNTTRCISSLKKHSILCARKKDITKKGYRDTCKCQKKALYPFQEPWKGSTEVLCRKVQFFLDKIEEKAATHELAQNMRKA